MIKRFEVPDRPGGQRCDLFACREIGEGVRVRAGSGEVGQQSPDLVAVEFSVFEDRAVTDRFVGGERRGFRSARREIRDDLPEEAGIVIVQFAEGDQCAPDRLGVPSGSVLACSGRAVRVGVGFHAAVVDSETCLLGVRDRTAHRQNRPGERGIGAPELVRDVSQVLDDGHDGATFPVQVRLRHVCCPSLPGPPQRACGVRQGGSLVVEVCDNRVDGFCSVVEDGGLPVADIGDRRDHSGTARANPAAKYSSVFS